MTESSQRCDLKKSSRRKTRFKFSLCIARITEQSKAALARLRAICDEAIPKKYDITVIDLSKNPELARDHNIIATPAVFRTLPTPVQRSIGDLSRNDRVLLGLNLKEVAADS